MKKYKIMMIIGSAIICLGFIVPYIKYLSLQTDKFQYIADNRVVVAMTSGFTTEQKQALEDVSGVSDINFINAPSNRGYTLGNAQNVKVSLAAYELPQSAIDSLNLPLVMGEPISSEDQVMISQSAAELLVANDFISSDVIGDKLNFSSGVYTISGVFADVTDQQLTGEKSDDRDNVNKKPVVSNFLSGVSMITTNYKPGSVEVGIDKYNYTLAYETFDKNMPGNELSTYSTADVLNQMGVEEAAVNNGQYGSTFDTIGYLTLDETSDFKAVSEQIEKAAPGSVIATNESTMLEYGNFRELLIIQVGLAIILVGGSWLAINKRER